MAEDGTYVVGGIGTAGMAAVAIGFAVLLAITVSPFAENGGCIA